MANKEFVSNQTLDLSLKSFMFLGPGKILDLPKLE